MKKKLNSNKFREKLSKLTFPVDLGFVYIPRNAVNQDGAFLRVNSQIEIQKTQNWRGNVLTLVLNPETESYAKHPETGCVHEDPNRTAIATFKRDTNGLVTLEKYLNF